MPLHLPVAKLWALFQQPLLACSSRQVISGTPFRRFSHLLCCLGNSTFSFAKTSLFSVLHLVISIQVFPGGSDGNLPQCQRQEFDPWVGKIPSRRAWPPTLVFLPGEFPGERSLVGYSPWGHKKLNMTE